MAQITHQQQVPPLTWTEQQFRLDDSMPFVDLKVHCNDGGPIHIYLVSDRQCHDYLDSRRFIHHGPGGVDEFTRQLQLPDGGDWWLVVENREERSVSIDLCLRHLPEDFVAWTEKYGPTDKRTVAWHVMTYRC